MWQIGLEAHELWSDIHTDRHPNRDYCFKDIFSPYVYDYNKKICFLFWGFKEYTKKSFAFIHFKDIEHLLFVISALLLRSICSITLLFLVLSLFVISALRLRSKCYLTLLFLVLSLFVISFMLLRSICSLILLFLVLSLFVISAMLLRSICYLTLLKNVLNFSGEISILGGKVFKFSYFLYLKKFNFWWLMMQTGMKWYLVNSHTNSGEK